MNEMDPFERITVTKSVHDRQIGITCSANDYSMTSLHDLLSHQDNVNSGCTQIFELPDHVDWDATLSFCNEGESAFYVHAPYNVQAWTQGTGALKRLKEYTDKIMYLPAAVVVHVGSTKRGGSIEAVAANMDSLHLERQNNRVEYPLLLENAAGEKRRLASDVNEIRRITEASDAPFGWCIDTQHAFASGMCTFDTHESIVKLFEDELPQKVKLIHLNDSKVGYEEKVDVHENIRSGHIWWHNTESLRSLIEYCKEKQIDMVLETPNAREDMKLIRQGFIPETSGI